MGRGRTGWERPSGSQWTGCGVMGSGTGSHTRPGLCPPSLGSYLIVDTIVVAATLLDGHAGLAVAEEAGVTLAALSTCLRAVWGGAECRASQGTGVRADLIVAVGGALHRCKEGVLIRAPSQGLCGRGCRAPCLSLLCLSVPSRCPSIPPTPLLCPLLTTECFGPPGINVASGCLASTHIGVDVVAENALVPTTQAKIKDTIF